MSQQTVPAFQLDPFNVGDTFLYQDPYATFRVQLENKTLKRPNYLFGKLRITEVVESQYPSHVYKVGDELEVSEIAGEISLYNGGWTLQKERSH